MSLAPALFGGGRVFAASPAAEVRREVFLPSPRAGVAVIAATYYTRPESGELISMHQLMSRSDTVDVAFLRTSRDHGRTWSEAVEIPTVESRPTGKFRRALRSGVADPQTGKFARFQIEGLLPSDEQIAGIFRRLGMGFETTAEGWKVTPPGFRFDVAIEADALQQALTAAVDRSFNRLLVDGCTSTNDTVIVLANGRAGNPPITVGSDEAAEVASALERVCSELALAMARDAEGGTRVVSIAVRGAASDADALRAARTVAASQLVQCSINGCDPYWGRVLAELGASGVELDPEHVDIAYGGVVVCRNGIAALHDVAAANAVVHQPEYTISCELHRGYGEATVITTDLSHAYIDENRGTS